MSVEKTYQIQGPFRVETSSDITLRSSGRGVLLDATGSDGNQGHIQLLADNTVTLDCQPAFVSLQRGDERKGTVVIGSGPEGTVVQMAGDPMSGAKIVMGKDSLLLTVGETASGASISLSPKGIILKIGTVALCLTSSGIEESVNMVSTRKLSATGHELKAAETQVKVDVVGVTMNAVVLKEQVQGLAQFQTSIFKKNVDGMEKDQAGMMMVN